MLYYKDSNSQGRNRISRYRLTLHIDGQYALSKSLMIAGFLSLLSGILLANFGNSFAASACLATITQSCAYTYLPISLVEIGLFVCIASRVIEFEFPRIH